MAFSGLTPTTVLRYINRMIGTVLQEIEISEEEMMRVVFQESLMTYSKFFPFMYTINVGEGEYLETTLNTYRIPRDDRLEILGIHKLYISNMVQLGSTMIPMSYNPFEGQIFNDYTSMTMTPVTWKWMPPNELTIFPKIIGYKAATLELKAIHPHHLKTIPMTMRNEFLNLALIDVLISIYPLRHRFESFNVPYGTIQPFMEMVDRAADDKKELLERWNSLFLKAARAKRIWIA